MNEAAKCSERDSVSGSRSSAERLREKRTFHSDPLAGTHGRESKPRISLLASPFVGGLEGFAGSGCNSNDTPAVVRRNEHLQRARRPRSSLRGSRHVAYAAIQPHLVAFGATLLTFLAEAEVPRGRVHG